MRRDRLDFARSIVYGKSTKFYQPHCLGCWSAKGDVRRLLMEPQNRIYRPNRRSSYVLFRCFMVMNSSYLVLAFVLIGFSIYVLHSQTEAGLNEILKRQLDGTDQATGPLDWAAIVLLVAGIWTLVVSILGLVGVCIASRWALVAYMYVILSAMVLQGCAMGLALYLKFGFLKNIEGQMLKTLEVNYDGLLNSTNALSRAFDIVHIRFQCCGVNSWRNFQNTRWFKRQPPGTTRKFPSTCCRLNNPEATLPKLPLLTEDILPLRDSQCPFKTPSIANEYTEVPCIGRVLYHLESSATVILALAIGVSFLEVVGLVAAKIVLNNLRFQIRRSRQSQPPIIPSAEPKVAKPIPSRPPIPFIVIKAPSSNSISTETESSRDEDEKGQVTSRCVVYSEVVSSAVCLS